MTFKVTRLEVMEAGAGGAVLGGFASVSQLLDPNCPVLWWFAVQALCFVGCAAAFTCAAAILGAILEHLRRPRREEPFGSVSPHAGDRGRLAS
jgi:hypothetical protein